MSSSPWHPWHPWFNTFPEPDHLSQAAHERTGAMSDPYGPNTAIVRRFLQRLAGKPATDCAAAARVYLSLQGTPALVAADRAVAAAFEESERTDARDAVVGPIIQLMNGHASRLESDPALAGVNLDDMAEAALAATLGLIVGDIIAADALEVLYKPYAELIPIEDIEGK